MSGANLGHKRKGRAKTIVSLDGLPRRCRSFMPDSGAHSLFNLHCFETAKQNGKEVRVFKKPNERYKWYSPDGNKLSKEFRAYLDKYVGFIDKYGKGIDHYVTVDAIYNPEISWKSLKYLESWGLKPIPVIHHRTSMRWIEKHLDSGYNYIGLGGLGQQSTKNTYTIWADQVFDRICQGSKRLPCVKTHGFAMTSYSLILRYPWWSVDSSSVFKCAGNGSIFVPHKRQGSFTFGEEPYVMGVSHRSSAKQSDKRHYDNLTKGEKAIVAEWLKSIDMILGTVSEDGEMDEYGVYSSYNARVVANLRFFERFLDWLPKWPWSFKIRPKRGFLKWEDLT